MRKFGGCTGKFGGPSQSENDSDREESTATGAGSTSVDSSSICTDAMSAVVPVQNSLPLPPNNENDCTHRAFYNNMYDEPTEPPHGRFENDIFEV